jgi:hypothetical protein
LGPFFVLRGLALFFNSFLVKKDNNMRALNSMVLAAMAMIMTSCEMVGDIFGAGVYTGIFIVIFVVVLIVVVISRIFRR